MRLTNGRNKLATGVALALLSAGAFAAEITFYESEDFRGKQFTTSDSVKNLSRRNFNDRASSVVVESGRWEVCEDPMFGGRCTLLRRGSYESLDGMGINNRISSVRQVERGRGRDDDERQSFAGPNPEYRRRPEERVFEVPVTSVHAVVGPPEQRCWIERQQVTEETRGGANVGGAIAGAIIGGILGHQIGGGRGKDIATAGGAVAGGAIGANAGRGSSSTNTYDQDVRRCENIASSAPEYWDVTYNYRGIEHRVQMTSPPGRVIVVNANGEPRA